MSVLSKLKRELKDAVKPSKLANSLKTICFFLLALLNGAVSVLIGLSVIVVGGIPFIVITGLSSIFLFIACKSDNIANIIEKYDLLGQEVKVRLDNISEFTQDINFLKQEIESMKSNADAMSIYNNEPINDITSNEHRSSIDTTPNAPIQMSARGFTTMQNAYTAKYDLKNDMITFTPRK
jgi:hypothetical protein